MAEASKPLTREVSRSISETVDEKSRRRPGRWLVLILVYFFLLVVTCPFLLYSPPAPGEGEALNRDVYAQVDFSFVSPSDLASFEEEREKQHKRVYEYLPDVQNEVLEEFDLLLETAESIDPSEDTPEEMVSIFKRRDTRLRFLTQENIVDFVEVLRDPRFTQTINQIIIEAYEENVIVSRPTRYKGLLQDGLVRVEPEDQLPIRRRSIIQSPLPLPTDWFAWNPLVQKLNNAYTEDEVAARARKVARSLLAVIIRPNLVFSQERTARSLEEYPKRDISKQYAMGEILVEHTSQRELLNIDEAALLRTHLHQVETQHRLRLIGHAIYTLLVVLIVSFFVKKFSRNLQFTTYNVILIGLPVVLGLSLQFFMILLADGNSQLVGYLFPAGSIGMLGVLLLDVRLALLLVSAGGLLFGLQVDLQYQYVIVGLFGGYTGIAAIYNIRKRWEVFLASVLVGVVNAAVILVTSIIRDLDQLPIGMAGLGFFAGVASFLVLAILPVFERFGILTDMQLLELTGLHHPLLRQIEELAPGTWQHTLNVAKLAEAAATEIGVNYLLVRAACYFHDIGKVKKPEYFTENQITSEDKMRHDKLRPQMSVLIIRDHVKEGVEMARAAKLPERIIDFIPQHHGTSLIRYFYIKAQEAQNRGEIKEPVRIDDYRYPGPKPQSIEAAIVMLADSVEATATAKLSGRGVREEDIQQVVRNTILEKFNDGQFDECNLTLRDLNVIREVFVNVLKSRFHQRIDYPSKASTSKSGKDKKEKAKGSSKKQQDDSTIHPQLQSKDLSDSTEGNEKDQDQKVESGKSKEGS